MGALTLYEVVWGDERQPPTRVVAKDIHDVCAAVDEGRIPPPEGCDLGCDVEGIASPFAKQGIPLAKPSFFERPRVTTGFFR